MSKFALRTLAVGETRYFEPLALGYKSIGHLRRNLAVVVRLFNRSNKDRLITTLTVGDKLSVRRWK